MMPKLNRFWRLSYSIHVVIHFISDRTISIFLKWLRFIKYSAREEEEEEEEEGGELDLTVGINLHFVTTVHSSKKETHLCKFVEYMSHVLHRLLALRPISAPWSSSMILLSILGMFYSS